MESIFMDRFFDLMTTGKIILDVGSGPGFDSKKMSERGGQVTGIDMADKLLEIATEIAPKVDFIKMDMRKISFPNSTFDGVWGADSILHIPKSESELVFSNIFRILKVGGIFFLGLKKGKGEEYKTNTGTGNLDGAKRYFAYYSKKEVDKLLSRIGFKILEYSEDTNRGNTWMNYFAIK